MNKSDVTREMLEKIRSMSPSVINEQETVHPKRNILKEEEEKKTEEEKAAAEAQREAEQTEKTAFGAGRS